MRSPTPPPPAVLEAFGADEPPRPLVGGSGGAWRCGDIVLKPSDLAASWLGWEDRLLHAVVSDDVRIQRPKRTRDGALRINGWVARDYLDGATSAGRWTEVIEAGDALHAALADVPGDVRTPPTDARSDPWAVADRIAWDEAELPVDDDGLPELMEARRPVAAPPAVIHGDLTGNVLFGSGLSPAVIDFSPYVRPVAYAAGVVVADAVVWHGAGLDLVHRVAERPAFGQCLLRALIFRHATALLLPGRLPTGAAAKRYAELRRLAIEMAVE